MRTPIWETSPGALAALLNSKAPLNKADLYTLTLPGGAVYRWCGSDVVLTGGGHTWGLGPGLSRSSVRFTVGVEVDTLRLTITDNVGTTINGVALMPFIAGGGLRNSRLQIDRAFWGAADAAPVGALLWFPGRISDTVASRYGAELSVRSALELLDVQVPRDLYQAGCLNTLFDSACGASRSSVAVTGATTSASNAARTSFAHGLSQPAGYFDLGVVMMTSGACTGISRTVKSHTTGGSAALLVLSPWPADIASGDTFTVTPGCTKALYLDAAATTQDPNGCWKFHASGVAPVRFRGQPWVPVPETVT